MTGSLSRRAVDPWRYEWFFLPAASWQWLLATATWCNHEVRISHVVPELNSNSTGRDSWKWNDCRWGGPDFSIKWCASIPNAKEAGPCEKPYKADQQHHNAKRGDAFRVEWPRNNHPGGFIRLSWLPTSQTELPNAHELFDGNAWVYTCFERVCHAGNYSFRFRHRLS